MKTRPGRLVLLGHPVSHSLSPVFQNAALRRAGIPLRYELLDVTPDALHVTLRELRAIGGAGNVTIPHKEAVARACDDLTPVAQRVTAVNTFWCESGRLIGDNTDVGGFEALALAAFGAAARPVGVMVAVIGAGGGAAAVLAALERWPQARARVYSRSSDRSARLAARFSDVAVAVTSVHDVVRNADAVVNATPIGLSDSAFPVDPTVLPRSSIVIDLVYRPGGTAWTQAATRLGHRAVDGTLMLLEQGAAAFERWFGVAPDRAVMRDALSEHHP